MFARLATTLAAGRRNAWHSAAFPDHRNEALRSAPKVRPVLVCRWTLDPASGRPVCAWHAEEAGVLPLETPPISRPVLAFAASGVSDRATAGALVEPRSAAARPPLVMEA